MVSTLLSGGVMPISFHHQQVPSFAQQWPAQVAAIIEAKLAEEVASHELRTIVLAPTADRLSFGVWLSVEWENHPFTEEAESAAGLVPLTAWLDGVDAIARGDKLLPATSSVLCPPVHFTDPKHDASFGTWWRELHLALIATAIEVGTKKFAGRFKHPVGVFVSMGTSDASLVAFCHARGAPLWPLRERRKEHGFGGVYPHAALTPEGLVIFYPEGEGAREAGPPAIRTVRLREVKEARVNRDRELVVHLGEQRNEVTFSAGHCHEENGGPSADEVFTALSTHVASTGRLTLADSSGPPPPLPATGEALAVALAGRGPLEVVAYLKTLAAAHQVPRVSPLVDTLGALPQKTLTLIRRELATTALEQLNWGEALAQVRHLSGADRWDWIELRALIGSGQFAAAMPLLEIEGTVKHLAERACALAGLGRSDEALAILGEASGGDELAARALAQANLGQREAVDTVCAALAQGVRAHLKAQLASRAEFQPALTQHEALEGQAHTTRMEAQRLSLTSLELTAAPVMTGAELPTRVLGAALRQQPLETPKAFFKAAIERPGGFWAADSAGALVELKIGVEPRTLLRASRPIDALAAVPGGVVLASGSQLLLVDELGHLRFTLQTFFRGEGPLAAQGGLIIQASQSVLNVYRLEAGRLTHESTFGMPGSSSIRGVGFIGPMRVAVCTADELLVVDLSRTKEPRAEQRFEGRFHLAHASVAGDLVLARDEWVYLMSTEGTLRATKRFNAAWTGGGVRPDPKPFRASTRDGRLALVDRSRVWVLTGDRLELITMVGPEGDEPEPVQVLLESNSMATAVTSHEAFDLAALPLDIPSIERFVEASVPPLRERLEAEVSRWLNEGVQLGRDERAPRAPLGAVVADWRRNDVLALNASPAASVVCLHDHAFVEVPLTPTPFEGDDPEARSSNEFERKQLEALNQARVLVGRRARTRAISALVKELATQFAPKTTVREFAVAIRAGRGLQVIAVVPGGGTLGPARATASPRPERTLKERLTSSRWYTELDALALRARRDAPFRAEVLALLASENIAAADRIAARVVDVDLAGCTRAWLAAAARDLDFALGGLIELHERGNATATHWLTQLADDPNPRRALPARRALGRLDEDATVELVKKRLSELEAYDDDSVPSKSLAALSDERLVRLQPALLAARLVLQRDGPLLLPLVRTGWVPDAQTMKSGNDARAREADFMSDLFTSDDEPDAEASALRLYAAKCIAKNTTKPNTSLWPAELPIEKARVSWQRFFTIAWPEWSKLGVLDRLHQVMPTRASASADDATFALQVLYQDLLRGDARAATLASALEHVPLDAAALRDVRRLASLSRLQFGWALVKDKRFRQARAVADAAVAESPTDGQVRFFDARLAWLEANDPRAALPRIDRALELANDLVGRARLLNLYGAAFDALGQYPEALEWYQRALRESESGTLDHDSGQIEGDASMTHAILSNLAETSSKMGDQTQARSYAEEAARRGSKTEIVRAILAQSETEPS